MDINHIVTIGCSFTYCQGLPIEQGWPSLLAKKLNCNLVNLGVPGIGNDAIHRKLYEYIYDDLIIKDSKPFVIIAWSQEYRHERWQKTHYYDTNFNDYAPIALAETRTKDLSYAQLDYLENFDEMNWYRQTMLYKASVINLLKMHQIPYIMQNAMASDFVRNKYLGLTETYKGIDSYSRSDENYLVDFSFLLKGHKFLPCGHYSYEGCTILSDHLLNNINRLYPDLNFVNDNNFYKLTDHVKKDKYHQKFPEWCNFTL